MDTETQLDVAVNLQQAPTVSADQLALIKKTVFVGASDEELQLFIYDCRRQGVHPLDRMIHPTKRKDKDGSSRYVAITSIDFMRTRAADTGEHVGTDDAVFVESGTSFPTSATVTVYRKIDGERCAFTATARWVEYYPGEQLGFMWRKMPYVMLGKCAEALALRKAFPKSLKGLYSIEEMDQAPESEPRKAIEEPQRKSTKTDPGQPGAADIKGKLMGLLIECCDNDEEQIKAKIVELTTYDKDGQHYEGKTSLADCSTKMMQVMYGKLQKQMEAAA